MRSSGSTIAALPHLYRLLNDDPLDRSLLAAGTEHSAVAPVVRAAGGDRDLARAVWAFAHGICSEVVPGGCGFKSCSPTSSTEADKLPTAMIGLTPHQIPLRLSRQLR
jgi:hypothetical protein